MGDYSNTSHVAVDTKSGIRQWCYYWRQWRMHLKKKGVQSFDYFWHLIPFSIGRIVGNIPSYWLTTTDTTFPLLCIWIHLVTVDIILRPAQLPHFRSLLFILAARQGAFAAYCCYSILLDTFFHNVCVSRCRNMKVAAPGKRRRRHALLCLFLLFDHIVKGETNRTLVEWLMRGDRWSE